nr:hypothetical protein CFP56_48879 [Quercus suber]
MDESGTRIAFSTSEIPLLLLLSTMESNSTTQRLIIGCRFRFRSAFDSYSIACEAFSEQQLLRSPINVKIKQLL